jgi:hypothetical protein
MLRRPGGVNLEQNENKKAVKKGYHNQQHTQSKLK